MRFCACYLGEYFDTHLSSWETSFSRCFNDQYVMYGLGYFMRLSGFVTLQQDRAIHADEVAAAC